jgi:hypothetical protein
MPRIHWVARDCTVVDLVRIFIFYFSEEEIFFSFSFSAGALEQCDQKRSNWLPNAAARVSAGATVSTDQYLCERPFAGDRVSGAAIIFLVPKTSPYDTLRRNLERERARACAKKKKKERQPEERETYERNRDRDSARRRTCVVIEFHCCLLGRLPLLAVLRPLVNYTWRPFAEWQVGFLSDCGLFYDTYK